MQLNIKPLKFRWNASFCKIYEKYNGIVFTVSFRIHLSVSGVHSRRNGNICMNIFAIIFGGFPEAV